MTAIEADLHDLRSEVDHQEMVDRFAAAWRRAGLDDATPGLLHRGDRLTRSPAGWGENGGVRLRGLGWSDRAIADPAQVCAYFNHINLIAEGLGVDDEEWLGEDGRPVS